MLSLLITPAGLLLFNSEGTGFKDGCIDTAESYGMKRCLILRNSGKLLMMLIHARDEGGWFFFYPFLLFILLCTLFLFLFL